MGEDMWRLWFTKLLVITVVLLATATETRSEDDDSLSEIRASRIARDLEGVTTVLLVSARPGKSVPPVGLLTKTARTFVQDGASTEFATQVLGTTLDNGRLYARILSTSSRVFYDKDPAPDSPTPYVVYPSRTRNDDWQLKVALENAQIKALKDLENVKKDEGQDGKVGDEHSSKFDEMSRENDIFSRKELGSDSQRFKPAKVRPAENLPTYTVKHEYVNSDMDNVEEEPPKSFRPRIPKILKPQPKPIVQKRIDAKPLATVTYHGFADFTTTVGETVIIFSPSTSPAPAARPATTIKGDATLRPDDGIAVVKIRPTSVVNQEKTKQHPGRISDPNSETGDPLLDAINRANIQPSVTEDFDVESSTSSTEPLLLVPDVQTDSAKPTGLLKVVDSTTDVDGTTTHYKSMIYGTYIGTNYAQIIHTSSNVYFFPDEATASYGNEDTTVDYGTTVTEEIETELDTTVDTTTGTTPRIATSSGETDTNELTTPFRGTTDSVLTTLKDILESARKVVLGDTETPASTSEDEIHNDIMPVEHRGRSIKLGSPKNDLEQQNNKDQGSVEPEEKVTLATRLLPSTVYKTFTYFTTFFIPNNDRTTTSIRSREVVSSDVTYLTELILPSETVSSIVPTALIESSNTVTTPSLTTIVEEEQTTKQDEEIELIFKTLYTTYTYLTTFFQENTSSISSREVVETNVVTQTVGPNGVSAVVAGLFDKDEPSIIAPTKISNNILPSTTPFTQEAGTEKYPTTMEQTTEDTLTTLQEQDTTTDQNIPTESGITMKDLEYKQAVPEIEPSPTPAIQTQAIKEQIKTYYTTYTYFTTIFVDDETEIETRTEVFTNVVTETIQPTPAVSLPEETQIPTTPKSEPENKPAVPPEILAYLEAIKRQKSQEEALQLAKKVQQQVINNQDEETTVIPETKMETTTDLSMKEEETVTENMFAGLEVNAQVTPNPPAEGEVLGSMVTDVVSSSSSGGGTVLDVMDKRNAVPEDQELSESNHHDVEPAPTLLLQTSYTTFTYFTTMYKGEESNVVSRLETITNVVTETIKPTAVVSEETSTLPVTYFTTFTYWTTFYKGGDTVTTSREETVSNVVTPGVTPTPAVELGVVMTYRPTTTYLDDTAINVDNSKVTADNEVTPSDVVSTESSKTEESKTLESKDSSTVTPEQSSVESSTISPEPTTYYTTYTYFTTSYIGNETILNSRLETVTSVSIPEVLATEQLATGRAINGPVFQQSLKTEDKPVTTSKTSESPKVGLISTVRSNQVNDGTTTHYMTDVHGTYIDGLYAQVVESSTSIETPPLPTSVSTPALPTGVLSMNKGSVIDADEITTVYFTTKQIGTLLDGLYAKVIESTSSTKIDEERKATIPPTQGHRTGLVRLIQGQIENNGTTTFYQSKVIGTSIEGRYAQIIESTSSFSSATPTLNVSPTSTLPVTKQTEVPEITPSPAVIQSSLSEEPTTENPEHDEDSEQNEESEEEEEDGEDGQSSKKKSRLTFSTRKRTFTPVIRPFASRNRPTFNPKRKGAQGATTITRTDITPTITATLAGKGNRFASSRGRASSSVNAYSSTLSPSGSRRFSGRRGSPNTASSFASTVSGSTRGRAQARITPSSVYQGNRRGPTSIRGSSARAATRGSSSIFPGASTRYRPPIRASSTLLRGQATVRHDDQENDANEFTTTTLVTEETPYTEEDEGGETVTAPLQTTTESSRRSTNPLLRFRRPINLNSSGRTGTTPRPSTTTRRNGNLNRVSSPTVPRVTNTRTNGRTAAPISTRPRQGSTGLFPPRGLFGKKQELPVEEQIEPNEDLEEDGEENFEDDPVEEIADNDYEGSEHEDRTTINRRSGKSVKPDVQIRPFTRLRRTRRQASQLRTLSSRFRRPTQPGSIKPEEKSDVPESVSSKEDTAKSNSKPIARYNNHARSLTASRSPSKPANAQDKSSAESTELSQSKVRNRSKQPTNGDRNTNSRIKPSPASNNGRQFTLREKENASSGRSGYKRPNSSTSRPNTRPSTNNADRVRPPRLRNNSNKSSESANARRVPPSGRTPSRTPSRNGNGRRGSTTSRSRGSLEDIREAPTVYPEFDGTITVTHYVPTEVTIPVVNNGVTEQRNIITAQPSTEVLGPSQYSTVTGGDGRPLVVIVSEVTGTNLQGQTEVTRFLLHETPTTRVSHTLTTLGGRRASQSVIVPTTVYSVENVVSTVQPSLTGNAPLANILLSQLLLGQLGQGNPMLQPQGTPSTQYNTRTTSYVTTITKQQSTVIPLTFRGKEILTTLVDTATDVITATEFVTDTVIVTPTAALPAANLNSLLLLLQQPQPQKNGNPLLDPLFAAAPFTQSNTLPGEVERRNQPADSDYKRENYEYTEEEEDAQEYRTPSKPRNNRGKVNEKKEDRAISPKEESSVVTLYVSGRRPGEFSTVLSTVKVGDTVSSSRRRRDAEEGAIVEVRPSIPPSLHAGPEEVTLLTSSEDTLDAHVPTQSLESVVDAYPNDDYDRLIDYEETPRKRVRIRIPVVRRNGRQHKLTVVRRRPVSSRIDDPPVPIANHTPRRIVVTRVRTLGLANTIQGNFETESFKPEIGKHKVTVTRRRKIEATPVPTTTNERRGRITRKKLVAVRPVQPTSTFAIITSGFFTAPSSEYDEDYSVEAEHDEMEHKEHVEATITPKLEDPPKVIDNKPEDVETEMKSVETESRIIEIENRTIETESNTVETEIKIVETETETLEATSVDTPVIITDNFFFPPSEDDYEQYDDDYMGETTTENEKEENIVTVPTVEDSSNEEENSTVSIHEETTKELEEDNHTTTPAEEVEKSMDLSTTAKTDMATTDKTLEETSEEDIPSDPETTEKDEDEKDYATTTEIAETMDDVEETTIATVSEDENNLSTQSDEVTTPIVEEEEEEMAQHPQTTTELIEEQLKTELEDSSRENDDTELATESIEPEILSQNETENSLNKVTEINDETSLTESTGSNSTNFLEKDEEVTQTESIDLVDMDDQDVSMEHSVVPITEIQRESEDTESKESTSSRTKPETGRSFPDMTEFVTNSQHLEVSIKTQEKDDIQTVQPITESTSSSIDLAPSFMNVVPLESSKSISQNVDDSEIPSVIPLEVEYTSSSDVPETTSSVTTSIASPTPEEIEAGLADDLYLSLSRKDIPEILPSKPIHVEHETEKSETPDLEPSTSVYYTETIATSTRLRTYTYVVTQLNGLETKVTSSTTVRPRVTTLTLTVPVTVTVTPTVESSAHFVSSVYSPVPVPGEHEGKDEEGRRLNLATRVMSNGVEVIVAGPTPALRWENSMPQPTLTLSDAVVMMLPQDKPNEFVTKTCTTTFTYLTTITKDGTTSVSTEQQVIANTATEERHRKPGSETAAVTLEASPTLRTEVFKTTYTYLTLNTDHSNVNNALESSTKVIANTVTAPQHYLDMILEPSEAPQPETNTYYSTRMLEKTFMEDGRTRIETSSDTITQLIVTESAPPPRTTSVATTLTALDGTEESMTNVMKTYYITYTYYNTFLENGNTVVRTNVATSTDVVLEKVPAKKTTTKSTLVNPTPEPIQIFATKTYLTTFTYFTTLLQAGPDGETSTTVSSRSHIVENVVTESIAPSLLDAGYMNALLTTAHHSDPVKNVVTGSTIIFFDEEDQIDPTTSSSLSEATPTAELQKDEVTSASLVSTESSPIVTEPNSKPSEQTGQQEINATTSIENDQNKKPSTENTSDLQVSNLLSLGSLGINSLSALGPVITAMAGLLQGKTTATRRNDSISQTESQEVTTQRAPIYIPVAEFADGDIEAAESQNIGTQLANINHNYIAETRHKVASSLADGIPISPGEVITANSDVIIGKPGKMAPRPPQTFLEDDGHIGMKPPPLPVPDIPVHPVLEVLEYDRDDAKSQQNLQDHKGPEIQIYPAHQIYEEHLKIPVSMPIDSNPSLLSKQPQKLLSVHSAPPKRMGSKQDVLENDPLLKPPGRPNVEQYANPNTNLKEPEWSPEKPRRPWSAKDPLKLPPPHPQFDQKIDVEKPPMEKPWSNVQAEEQKRPAWAQKDPLLPETSIVIQSSESKAPPAEPIVHQVPHVIERSTGQPLLVNIQPSQVANVVIPQGGTQALIFGDTSEPHISGQYFDDPSPYPESEVGLEFVGIQKVENLPQYTNGKDPVDYMVPPSPPTNFKEKQQSSSNRPAAIPLSPIQFDYERPQDKFEALSGGLESKPSDVHFIKHPENSGVLNGQGHVHTEILVHHRPESVNVRPQIAPHPPIHSHTNPNNHLPPRGQYPKIPKPVESATPPRRTEMSDNSHRYIFLAKPDSGNEIVLNSNWKTDKKPPRILLNNRLRPRPPLRSTTSRPLDRPVYIERPNIRKPVYGGPQRLPVKPQNTFMLPHRPFTNPQVHREPPRTPTSATGDSIKETVTERQPSFEVHHQQIPFKDRPSQFFSDKRPINVGQLRPQSEGAEEHVPTGAIEYHNPSNPKVKQEENPIKVNPQVQNIDQSSSVSEEKQDTWHSNTQTEKPLDSEVNASDYYDYVKELPKYNQTGNDTSDIDNRYKNTTFNNSTSNNGLSIDDISMRKPNDNFENQKERPVWINPGTPFHRDENIPSKESHESNYYNNKPQEMPIVQSKPFGVYAAHEASNYDSKQKENKPEYDIVQGVPTTYYGNKKSPVSIKNRPEGHTSGTQTHERDDTIDLKPPAIIPQFIPEINKPSRPYQRPATMNKKESRPPLHVRPEVGNKISQAKPDQIKQSHEGRPGILQPSVHDNLNQSNKLNQSHSQLGGFVDLSWDNVMKNTDQRLNGHEIMANKSDIIKHNLRNNSISHQIGSQYVPTSTETVKLVEKYRPQISHQANGPATKIRPEYPHIITKPKPSVPGPITISSSKNKPENRPNIRFSMPVEAIGEEVDSKTQTERPPSMLITPNNVDDKKKNDEILDASYQTNFATSDVNKVDSMNRETKINIRPIETASGDMLSSVEGMNVPSRDMMPPPLRPVIGLNQSNKNEEEGLKPPPIPSRDVLGLSPPPVDITTTRDPLEDTFAFGTVNESGLKLPPKYIPLKESSVAPLPSVSMVPPSPRPSVARPFIVELLSQDMVPPPPVTQTTRPLEIATVRPAVAVSGSIQIATAVATSHIPVIQDMESKIPIIHGTVDLPVVVDVPEILRPVESRMTEHVSIYTVRPFDTRPVSRISVQPTAMQSSNVIVPTKLRPIQVDHIQPSRSSSTTRNVEPTRSHNFEIPRNPVKRPEHPIFLESSHDNILPSTKVEATDSLTHVVGTSQREEPSTTRNKVSIISSVTERKRTNETSLKELPSVVTRIDSSITRVTNTLSEDVARRKDSVIKMTKGFSDSTRDTVKGTTTSVHTSPKEVTRFQTSTVTRVETSVLGSPPTTRTLLLTHTLTSTTVETVTETLLRPTSVVATVTSTILQSVVTRVPSSFENVIDNDSIFVVVSDQKPPAPGGEEVEAEYGDISRDEQDPAGNEIHRVLAGGILGAPVVSLHPVVDQCSPECRAFKAETCTEIEGEMRCVCRPGFARMFPDRPCKPTYTYTLQVGLDRIGHEPVTYDSSMNDTSSAAFNRLLGPTKDALDRTLMQSDLRDVYRGLKVAGFSSKPTKVEFHVQLSDNANETRLKEILKKYLIGSNYSLGGTEVFASKNLDMIDVIDFDECTVEGGPHHDCSPNAACFNLRGSYQCSCKEGFADLSENPAYPGRICSQAPLGCPSCNNKGHCVTNTNGQEVCECFPWHSGQRCQVNLKVLLIALVTTGAILLGLLAVCVGMACFRQPIRKRRTGDRRAMIPGTGGDTSSEGSVTDLAIPHHVPHVLPPPPQMIAPLPPSKRPARKVSTKPRQPSRKATMVSAPVAVNDEQRDRSLTVMIPRAKYRSAPQSPQNYKPCMSTFSTEEHKLLNYLDNGTHPVGNRKQSIVSTKDCKETEVQVVRTQTAPTGALVSAGFQVSATVTRQMDTESTLARSCGETTVETATKVLRTDDLQGDHCSTLARSCGETTIQAPTKLLRLDLGEAGSTLARSCGETTIQPPTKVAAGRRNSVKDARDNRDTRDSASEGHTMAERDLGSTLRLPAQHPPLYSPDRTSDRESNFDSL